MVAVRGVVEVEIKGTVRIEVRVVVRDVVGVESKGVVMVRVVALVRGVVEIRIKIGRKKIKEELIRGWNPGWSPEIALMDYHDPAPILEDGVIVFPPPFSEMEDYDFPSPVGNVLISQHCHEEAVLMGRFIGKGLKYCDFKYPFDPIAAALVEMGFANEEKIDVKGMSVSPLDVIAAMVPLPANMALLPANQSNHF